MPLHPQVKVVLDLMEKAGPPLHHLSPQQAREAFMPLSAAEQHEGTRHREKPSVESAWGSRSR